MKAITRLVTQSADETSKTPYEVLKEEKRVNLGECLTMVKVSFGDYKNHQMNYKEAKILKKAIADYDTALTKAERAFNDTIRSIR
jgi:hypothetical protein